MIEQLKRVLDFWWHFIFQIKFLYISINGPFADQPFDDSETQKVRKDFWELFKILVYVLIQYGDHRRRGSNYPFLRPTYQITNFKFYPFGPLFHSIK